MAADGAVAVAPGWHKAHWRRGAALRVLRRSADAVDAYLQAWKCSGGAFGRNIPSLS